MEKIPKKLENDPILEAMVVIQFQPLAPLSTTVGLIYSLLKDQRYIESDIQPQTYEGPINILAEKQYQPHYALRNENFIIQFGPSMISFHNAVKYLGWATLFPKIVSVLKTIESAKIIHSVKLIGLRYINFFSNTRIFSEGSLEVRIPDYSVAENSLVRMNFLQENVAMALQVTDNAIVEVPSSESPLNGSIIDIECMMGLAQDMMFDVDAIAKHLNDMHEKEKKLFFSTLGSKLLKDRGPSYDQGD